MRIITLTILCTLIVTLSACQQFTKPRPWGLGETPDGTPEFRKGWEDGCDTGLRAYGGHWYRNRSGYKHFKQDLTLIHNPEYYRAWRDAFTYCRWYVWNWQRPARGTNNKYAIFF